jgi:hypothetical protein
MRSYFAVEHIRQYGVVETTNTSYVNGDTAQDAEDYVAKCAPFFKRIVKTTRLGDAVQQSPRKRQ